MVYSDPLGWPQLGASFSVDSRPHGGVLYQTKSSLCTRVLANMQQYTCPSIDCIRGMCSRHRKSLNFTRTCVAEIEFRNFVAKASWTAQHARALKTKKQITQMVKQPCGDNCFRSRTNMVCDDSAWLHRLILLTSTTKIGRSEPSKYRAIHYQRYSHFGTRWCTL